VVRQKILLAGHNESALRLAALRQNFRMPEHFQTRDPKLYEAAIRRFDEENARDPNQETAGGVPCRANCFIPGG